MLLTRPIGQASRISVNEACGRQRARDGGSASAADTAQPLPCPGHVRVEFFAQVPADPNAHSRVFISGSHVSLGNWRANGFELRRLGPCAFAATIDLPRHVPIEFKLTRGTWDTVECAADGSSLPNRRLSPDCGTLSILAVERWSQS